MYVGAVVRTVPADSIAARAPATTLSQLLTSRVPGLQVLSQDGSVGAGPVVTIRGYSGGQSVSTPLLFIDGLRVDDLGGIGTDIPPLSYHPAASQFDDIAPDEIERIDVLPGAAAASLYGPGAGNGVILVTTKRHGGAPVSGDVMAEGGVATTSPDAPQSYFDWGHKGTTIGQCPLVAQAENECTLDSVTHFNPLTGSGTSPLIPAYWQRYGANVGVTIGAQQISLSGHYANEPGTLDLPPVDRAVYRSDFGASPSADQVHPSAFDQGQLRGSIVSRIGSTAQVSLTAGYIGTHQRDGAIDSFLSDAALGTGARSLYDGWSGPQSRPAFDLAEVSTDRAQHVLWNLQSDWRPAPAFDMHAMLGTDMVSRTTGDLALGVGNGPDSLSGVDEQRLVQYMADVGGSWTTTVVRGVQSRASIGLQYLAANASDTAVTFDSGDNGLALDNGALRFADLTQSAYASEALSIIDKVSVAGTVRLDHHRLQTGLVSSSAAYPSVSASWAVLGTSSDPRVRLHAALGETSTPVGAVQLAAMSLPLEYTEIPLRPATRQRETEAGIDASLPGDRVTASFTTYARRTVNALFPFTESDAAGSAIRTAEQGTVSDRGVEFSTTAHVIDRPMIAWDATLTAYVHENKVLRLPADEEWYDGMLRIAAGHSVFGIWAGPYTYEDKNHDGIIEPDEVSVGPQAYVGPSSPTHEASLGTTVHLFKRAVSIGLLFDYRGGYVLPDQNSVYQSAVYTTRAQNIPGSSLAAQALPMAFQVDSAGWPSGYVDRVSALRWRELSVSGRLPIARPVEVTLAVRNLALWTKYPGDPDIDITEQPPSIASIAPTLQLPQPRTWLLRVTAPF
jgi:TonB-dependent SusC/RagA subfamily outer membrane receptor